MLAIQETPAHQFLRTLGESLPRPTAILIVSAHWESTGGFAVSTVVDPETIHDFGGFPRALFDIQYTAHGSPETAIRAAKLLEQAGIKVTADPVRGLDHGAWVPLRLMYPEADIPVAQLSVLRGATPADHVRVGHALRTLGDEGVLVIGSGSLTHNLYEFRGQDITAHVPSWVQEFDKWMEKRLELAEVESLIRYREMAPSAQRNHPTEEHLLPLFVAMSAAGATAKAKRLHGSFEYGVLAMSIYEFQ